MHISFINIRLQRPPQASTSIDSWLTMHSAFRCRLVFRTVSHNSLMFTASCQNHETQTQPLATQRAALQPDVPQQPDFLETKSLCSPTATNLMNHWHFSSHHSYNRTLMGIFQQLLAPQSQNTLAPLSSALFQPLEVFYRPRGLSSSQTSFQSFLGEEYNFVETRISCLEEP